MLNCVYGAAGSGKTQYVYEKIRRNMEKGIKSFILVPEQSSMDTEREMLRILGMSAQFKVEVLTFSRLSNLVFSSCGPLRLKYIDKAGKLFVIQRTLQNLENSLEYYKRNVHMRGFAQVAASLISELKRYGVDSDSLYEAAEKVEAEELSKKLFDIALIYKEYDRLIGEKYSDAEENLIKAALSIVKSGLFGGEFFVMGFKSFTPVEQLALTEIMKTAEVTLVLCADNLSDDNEVFAAAAMTWRKLKINAEAVGVAAAKPVSLAENGTGKLNNELAHLQNNYFKYPADIYNEETQNISLIFANDGYDEVRHCAEAITMLCRKDGYRYRDILVLARNIDDYRAEMRAVFEEYNIDCFINAKMSLSSNPFIRKIMAVLEILSYDFSYERIMPVVRFGGNGYTAADADIFENYVLGSNITYKYWNTAKAWVYNPDEKRIDLDAVNRVKVAAVNPIIKFKESIKGRKTAGEICRGILEWIKKDGLGEFVSQRVDEFNALGEAAEAMEYTRAWNMFSSIISQMEECLGDEYITSEKFYELFRAACDEVSIGITPLMSDQITVAEIDTFRKCDAKVVFVLGLLDGVFPKGYIEDGMLSDAEREALNEFGIELAPTADYKRREEQNLIYNVLTAAKERLFLSVPLGDKEGKALTHSAVIDRVRELFPNIKIFKKDEISQCKEVIFKSLLGALAKAGGDKAKLCERDRFIYDCFAENEEIRRELLEFESMAKKYSPDARLSPGAAKELYGERIILSVSKLEKYNSCAFSYFMRYGLLAKERFHAEAKANNIGSVLHETLQIYFEELKNANADYGKITEEMCRQRIGEIAEKSAIKMNELLYETSPYYRYVALRIKSVAAATAWEIVRFYAFSKYRPYGFEVKIGGDGLFSGTEIDLGDSKATIEGFIDRIDTAEINGERYVNIVDYKSSAKNTDETLEEAGVQIQPLVYAGIACKNLNACPSGMMYIHMNEPMLRFDSEPNEKTLEAERRKNVTVSGIVLDEDEIILGMDSREDTGRGYIPHSKSGTVNRERIKERIEAAEEKAKETAFKIISGDISIKPYITKKYNPCRYCDYFGACGKKGII